MERPIASSMMNSPAHLSTTIVSPEDFAKIRHPRNWLNPTNEPGSTMLNRVRQKRTITHAAAINSAASN
jgi:hypothetical protein